MNSISSSNRLAFRCTRKARGENKRNSIAAYFGRRLGRQKVIRGNTSRQKHLLDRNGQRKQRLDHTKPPRSESTRRTEVLLGHRSSGRENAHLNCIDAGVFLSLTGLLPAATSSGLSSALDSFAESAQQHPTTGEANVPEQAVRWAFFHTPFDRLCSVSSDSVYRSLSLGRPRREAIKLSALEKCP